MIFEVDQEQPFYIIFASSFTDLKLGRRLIWVHFKVQNH